MAVEKNSAIRDTQRLRGLPTGEHQCRGLIHAIFGHHRFQVRVTHQAVFTRLLAYFGSRHQLTKHGIWIRRRHTVKARHQFCQPRPISRFTEAQLTPPHLLLYRIDIDGIPRTVPIELSIKQQIDTRAAIVGFSLWLVTPVRRQTLSLQLA